MQLLIFSYKALIVKRKREGHKWEASPLRTRTHPFFNARRERKGRIMSAFHHVNFKRPIFLSSLVNAMMLKATNTQCVEILEREGAWQNWNTYLIIICMDYITIYVSVLNSCVIWHLPLSSVLPPLWQKLCWPLYTWPRVRRPRRIGRTTPKRWPYFRDKRGRSSQRDSGSRSRCHQGEKSLIHADLLSNMFFIYFYSILYFLE